MYLTRRVASSQSQESQKRQGTKQQLEQPSIQAVETSGQDVSSCQQKDDDKHGDGNGNGRQHLETAVEASRISPGGSHQWEESSIQSAPRQSQSVDPSQLSG